MKGFLAALMMFTRLPLWRFVQVDKKYFSEAITYWPLVGFVTGITTAGVLWLASLVMPILPACVLAIIARILLTGAMHEDGLADFLDGFGGGTTKEKILAIMKDSHIGCYGTIGLVLYFLLYTSFLYALDVSDALPIIVAADVFSKFCAATMINTLSYVRKEDECKTGVLYSKVKFPVIMVIALITSLPFWYAGDLMLLFSLILPIITAFMLRGYLKSKIGGYTGDCCGACVLIIEQAFYLGAVIIYCL